ncbi:MAG: hypothetical protein ACLFUV_04045 [Methanomassiliicoccales archaeon]
MVWIDGEIGASIEELAFYYKLFREMGPEVVPSDDPEDTCEVCAPRTDGKFCRTRDSETQR